MTKIGIASSWLSGARIKRIERAYPELRGEIALDQTSTGPASGAYAGNAASKLRASGEHELAALLARAVEETE